MSPAWPRKRTPIKRIVVTNPQELKVNWDVHYDRKQQRIIVTIKANNNPYLTNKESDHCKHGIFEVERP